MKTELKLVLSHFENERKLVFILETDWMRNLGALLWIFVVVDNLLEMGVKCLGNTSVFALALVFFAECKDSASSFIVELEELAIGPQSVQDSLADVHEEEGTWLDGVLLLQFVEVSVSHKDELVGTGNRVLGVFSWLFNLITEKCDKLIVSVFLFEVKAHLFTLVTKVSEHLFKKVHGLMLAEVTEGTDVLFEVKGGELLRADIDHLSHETLKEGHV